MKILTGIDVPFRQFGGSLIGCNDWYSNLPSRIDIRFLTLPPNDSGRWWSMDDVVMMDIEKDRSKDGFFDYLGKLRRIVEEQIEMYRPDIIHCQHLNFGLSRVFADLEINIPKIGICHGTDVQLAMADGFFLDNLRVITDAMDILLFPSENMANDFFSVYQKNKPYLINPYGIPDKFYARKLQTRTHQQDAQLHVLYAGRLLSWKGADIVVEAMRYVKDNIHLTVIGDEDEKDYAEKLRRLVKENQLENRVSFKKQMTREKLHGAFHDYDVIVFPSTGVEAFSITTIEAQTAGLPVIYARAGGIVNAVQDSGISISHNTPQEWARLLEKVYANPQLLEPLRVKGYENANRFRLAKSQKRLFDISSLVLQDRL